MGQPSMMMMRMAGGLGRSNVVRPSCARGLATGQDMDLSGRGRKTDYIKFMKAATTIPNSPEQKALNHFLVRCFIDVDTDFDGKVRWPTFNFLMDSSVVTPRFFGIIESRAEVYKSVEEMNEARRDMFKQIDRK